MKKKPIKVLILHEIFTPYRIPLFNQIASLEWLDLSVYYLAASTVNKIEWKNLKFNTLFKSKTLKSIKVRANYERFIHINYTLFYSLIRLDPDIIILPGFNIASMQALLYAKLFSKPTIVWSEPTKYTEIDISVFRLFLRKLMFKYIDAAITPGQLAKEYLLSLSGDNRREKDIYKAFQSVDTDYYNDVMRKYKKDEAVKNFKSKYCQKNILFIGQIIERKGIWEMLKVFESINKNNSEIGLIILGSGEELNKLKEYVIENKISNIHFEGFIQQKDILKYFAISDIFMLLSHFDCNPLVIYEAISSGLPIIANYKVGNTPELVHDDKNGFIVDIENVPDIVEKTLKIMQNEKILKSFSDYSIKLSEKVTYKKSAQVFHEVIESLLPSDT